MGFTNVVDYTMIIMEISIEISVIYGYFYLVVNYLRIVSKLYIYITPVLSVDEKPTYPTGWTRDITRYKLQRIRG